MRKQRGLFVGLAAIFAMLFFAGTAYATETATITPTLVSATSAGQLTLSNDIVSIFCELDLSATFAPSIVLELDDLTRVGGVTSGSTDACDGAEEVLLLGLSPDLTRVAEVWDIAVLLPLPDPRVGQANIRILDARILVNLGTVCLYQGNLLATLNPAGTQLIFALADNSNLAVDTAHSDPICSFLGAGTLQGTVDVRGHDDGSAVRVTLRA